MIPQILLALFQAGRIAGPLAAKLVKPVKKIRQNIDRDYGKLKYIHPYGTISGGLGTNAYLYGGIVHDEKTGSLGSFEKKRLANIWNELDYNRGRLEGDELVRHIFKTNDYPYLKKRN